MSKVTPLDTPFSKQPADDVTTYDNSDIWSPVGAFGRRYNPDELVQKRGLRIYGEMMHDEQVKAVTEFKLNAILSRGWEFKFDEDSELSDEEKTTRVKLFKLIIKRMRGSFHDVLDGISSGREFGFSVSEKIYGTVESQGKKYIGLNKVVIRNPDSFEFYSDEYGEIIKIEQWGFGVGRRIEVDQSKIIHYVHKPKWDVVYGRSDLRAAYRAWYCKETLIKLWLLYLEKFGGGIGVATRTGEDAPSSGSAAGNSLENALRNLGKMNSIILPRGITLDIKFPTANDGYESAVTFFDLAIAKSLLVPNLLGLSHAGQTGAFAQSQTQLEAFYWTLLMDANRLADTVNEQLFRDLGDQNWGDGDYPEFCFKPASMENIKWIVTTWKDMVGSNIVINTEEDEKFIRKLMDMPMRSTDAEPLVNPVKEREMSLQEEVARAGVALNQEAAANPKVDATVEKMISEILSLKALVESKKDGDVIVNNEISPAAPVAAIAANVPATSAAAGEIHFHGPMINCTSEMARKAVARVAFSVIGKRTEDAAVVAITDLSTAIAKATKRALGDDESLTLLLDSDTADVAAFQLNVADVGKLKSLYSAVVKRGWQIGQDHARNEIETAHASSGRQMGMRISASALRDKAAGFFEAQSFRMAGDTSDKTKKIIQQELQNGIKFDKSVADVRASIWDRLVAQGLTRRQIVAGIETDEAVNKALDALWLDTEEQATAYLNTLVRTNTFEALNEARFQEFTDPALAGFIQALQYAAVLDSSVTDICEALGSEGPDGDGVIYTTDSPLWDTYRPPNHFNCRSVLVPITTEDGWDGEESDEPDVEPQEGFK